MKSLEVNFDGLVGPTHNYAGLAYGNIASLKNRNRLSNPKQAALQGLSKMEFLMELGLTQAVLPPQIRPHLPLLRQLGFQGSPQTILNKAWKTAPDLFAMASSASAMWVANAATVTPSSDSESATLCITPANLISQLHRHIESEFNYRLFQYLFSDPALFTVNAPLPSVNEFSDEGAANHMRLYFSAVERPLHVFVYGMPSRIGDFQASRYPARQTLSASRTVARLNGLTQRQTVFVRQAPGAIDQGVFHNDVIALSHEHYLFCHEKAFLNQKVFLNQLVAESDGEVKVIETSSEQIALSEAVDSYLYNSQIVTIGDDQRVMLLPNQCQTNSRVKEYVETELSSALELSQVSYFDVQQSMSNGGGPACLRLRMPMTEPQLTAMNGHVLLNRERLEKLKTLVEARYPERFQLRDLTDWGVCQQLIETVVSIYQILGLPAKLYQQDLYG